MGGLGMFKKALSILIASSLMVSTAIISAGATEAEENEETAVIKTISQPITTRTAMKLILQRITEK